MRLKLYIFTKRRAVVEVDGPTKALAWAEAKKVFREIRDHEAELAEVGPPPRVYDIPQRNYERRSHENIHVRINDPIHDNAGFSQCNSGRVCRRRIFRVRTNPAGGGQSDKR